MTPCWLAGGADGLHPSRYTSGPGIGQRPRRVGLVRVRQRPLPGHNGGATPAPDLGRLRGIGGYVQRRIGRGESS